MVLGQRPWFDSTVYPRLAAYASRVEADLIIVEGNDCYTKGLDFDDFRTCAHARKIWLLGNLLRCYERVILADDTLLIRG